MRTLVCPPGAETFGANLRAFTDNLQGAKTRPVMEKHHIADVDPTGWYPMHRLMDALNELGQSTEYLYNMVAVGMEVGLIVPLPPEMLNPTLGQVLPIWDDLYQALHRNGDVGRIRAEKVNEKHYKTTHTDLNPDDFTYGLLYGYGRRFLPAGTNFAVYYDEEILPRDQGGQEGLTVIHIEWE